MKSSTIRRSTLSKESMEVIETLAKESQNEDILDEYVRPEEESASSSEDYIASKAQEIDLLWQNFKATQFNTNSPVAYALTGFAVGVLVSIICFVILGLAVTKSGKGLHIGNKVLYGSSPVVEASLNEQADEAEQAVEAKVSVPLEEESVETTETQETAAPAPVDNSKVKKYIVKDGDTVESIIIKNYGSYSPEKADLIMKANNMKSLDRINIDQELLLPIE